MKKPETPLDEAEWLADLWDYGILDTPPEKVFADITELAARICAAPWALINLIDENRQWFKSAYGIEELRLEPQRETSICAHTILQREYMEIEDTATSDLFTEEVLAGRIPGIRFYAGANMVNPRGRAIGVLYVFGPNPRQLTDDQRDSLRKLAETVVTLVEARKEERLRKRLQRHGLCLDMVLNSAAEGLFALDTEGKCVIVNDAAARLTGWPKQDLLHHSIHARLHYAHADGRPYPECDCPACRTLSDGVVCHVADEVYWRKDGTTFPVE